MIPEFLKIENIPKEKSPMKIAMDKYKAHFGEYPSTEPSDWSDERWIEILNSCIQKNIDLGDLLQEEYNSEYDY